MGVFQWGYDVGLAGYRLLLGLASGVHPKARQWVEGRRNWRQHLQTHLDPHRDKTLRIWMHCASLGEFEQGRVLLDSLRDRFPDALLVLSFFSPSGYEHRKHYPSADLVCYLPLDTGSSARDFLDLVRPNLVVFIKYEFWYHYIHQLHQRSIPLVVVSARFRPEQIFFRSYGSFFRKLLQDITWLFVQDEPSLNLLKSIGIQHASIAGDTRFDRVVQVAAQARVLPAIEAFIQGRPTLVAGSTWPKDEHLLREALPHLDGWCCILVPHEVDEAHLKHLDHLLEGQAVRYSSWESGHRPEVLPTYLIMDRIGLLSSVYRYGRMAYIGGGFNQGIHNILEAAVYGMPLIFGPKWQAFREAEDLISLGAALSVSDASSLIRAFQYYMVEGQRTAAAMAAGRYVNQNKGATAGILEQLQEKRLLTKS